MQNVLTLVSLASQTISEFSVFSFNYSRKHILSLFVYLEEKKDILVKFLMMKRGRYNRPFLHFATISLLAIGVLVAPLLADTYPIFTSNAQTISKTPSPSSEEQSIQVDNSVFSTITGNQNVRTSTITYTVSKGDTISSIAQKFGISEDTIRWANDLSDDSISVGDTLQILPVTGLSYKVQSGDTVYTIAKKFATDAQKIADFPFNNFANPETFSLVEGQMLIVPDGVKPSEQASPSYQTTYASAPVITNAAPSAGGFIWPLSGLITQYFSWFHTGIDIAGPVGTPIYAAKSGIIAEASCGWNYGYGCHILMDNGGGYSTMYAHMVTQPIVGVGQSVGQGQLIGYRGNTGRSTGPHTHFEIRVNGHVVNPIPYLQ